MCRAEISTPNGHVEVNVTQGHFTLKFKPTGTDDWRLCAHGRLEDAHELLDTRTQKPTWIIDSVHVDTSSRTVKVCDIPVPLSAKEYDLVQILASDPYRVFTKQELLREVWGFRSNGRTRTLDSHASRLRRKLEAHGAPDMIANTWGVGYSFAHPRP